MAYLPLDTKWTFPARLSPKKVENERFPEGIQ
jgi:hypothetical protein